AVTSIPVANRHPPDRIFQELDQDDDDDRRQVQAADRGNYLADGAEDGLGQGDQNAQHRAHEVVVLVDDIEGSEPAYDHRDDHDPFVNVQDFVNQEGDRVHHGAVLAAGTR